MHVAIDVRAAVLLSFGAIHVAVAARAILLDGREPYARAAWLLLLVALPGVGTVLYVLFGEPWISSGFRRRSRDAYQALLPFAPPAAPEERGPTAANPFRTCEAASRFPSCAGNVAVVAPDEDAAMDMVVADIDAAARSIHLSFYIWLRDGNGTKVVEAVCRAARRGVACRIVADAIGSRALIRSDHWNAMEEAGARQCARRSGSASWQATEPTCATIARSSSSTARSPGAAARTAPTRRSCQSAGSHPGSTS